MRQERVRTLKKKECTSPCYQKRVYHHLTVRRLRMCGLKGDVPCMMGEVRTYPVSLPSSRPVTSTKQGSSGLSRSFWFRIKCQRAYLYCRKYSYSGVPVEWKLYIQVVHTWPPIWPTCRHMIHPQTRQRLRYDLRVFFYKAASPRPTVRSLAEATQAILFIHLH